MTSQVFSHVCNVHELDTALENIGHRVTDVHGHDLFRVAAAGAELPHGPWVGPGGEVLVHVVEASDALGEREFKQRKDEEDPQVGEAQVKQQELPHRRSWRGRTRRDAGDARSWRGRRGSCVQP